MWRHQFASTTIRCHYGIMIKMTSICSDDVASRIARPRGYKTFLCSTRLSINFFLLINVKMPTIVGILIFMSRKNSILGLSEPEKCWISWYFYTYEYLKFHAQLSWAWKTFYNLGARCHYIKYQPVCTVCHFIWIVDRGSYTGGHFIWNLWNSPKAHFINFILNDNECKIRFIIWPFKMRFYRLQNELCFNKKRNVDMDVVSDVKLRVRASMLLCVWSYDFYHTTLSTE